MNLICKLLGHKWLETGSTGITTKKTKARYVSSKTCARCMDHRVVPEPKWFKKIKDARD